MDEGPLHPPATASAGLEGPVWPERPYRRGRLHLLRIAHRIGEGDSSPLHAIGRFDPEVKAQTIQRGHRHLLRLHIAVYPGEEQQRRSVAAFISWIKLDASSARGSTAAAA